MVSSQCRKAHSIPSGVHFGKSNITAFFRPPWIACANALDEAELQSSVTLSLLNK